MNTIDKTQKATSEAMAKVILQVEELQAALLTADSRAERAFKVGFGIAYSGTADIIQLDEYWDSVQDVILSTETPMPTYH